MNRRESQVLLRPEPMSGRRPKNHDFRIASNARSPAGSTPDTCPFRRQCQQTRAASDELTLGFLRHRRTRRMMATKRKSPVSRSQTGPGGHSPRPRQAIPRWVAPLQSPTPFHLAAFMILQAPSVRSRGTKTGSQVAQNSTARNVHMTPKPAEPDPRLRRPSRGPRHTIMSEMTAANLTPAEPPLQ
jgi:hypothetical protein